MNDPSNKKIWPSRAEGGGDNALEASLEPPKQTGNNVGGAERGAPAVGGGGPQLGGGANWGEPQLGGEGPVVGECPDVQALLGGSCIKLHPRHLMGASEASWGLGGPQGGLWEDFGTDGSKSVFVPLVYWLLFFFLGPSWAPPAGPSSWWAPPRRRRGRLMLLGRRIGVLLDGLGALVGASSSWAVRVSDEGFATKRRRMRRLRVYNSLHNIGNDPG